MIQRDKMIISIVGFGNVGRTISLLLHSQKEIEQLAINIIDISENLSGTLLDLGQASKLFENRIQYTFNDWFLYEQSNFIFHCAGVSVPPGASRRQIVEENKRVTKELFQGYSFINNPIVIVVTNPVDIISNSVVSYSNIPSNKVIGVGTFLDTIRMRHFLSEALGDNYSFNSILLGEHGDAIVYMSQYDNFASLNLPTQSLKEIIASCLDKTKDSAHQIKKTQGATIYGVASCAIEILHALLKPTEKAYPLSVSVPKEYLDQWGFEPFYMSLPVTLDKSGVKNYEPLKATKEELKALRKAGELLSSF